MEDTIRTILRGHILLLVLLSLISKGYSQAGDYSARVNSAADLLRDCDEAVKAADGNGHVAVLAAHCIGYTEGFVDSLRLWRDVSNLNKLREPDICLPDDFDSMQATRVLVTYMKNNPDRHDWKAVSPREAIVFALHASYRCSVGH